MIPKCQSFVTNINTLILTDSVNLFKDLHVVLGNLSRTFTIRENHVMFSYIQLLCLAMSLLDVV